MVYMMKSPNGIRPVYFVALGEGGREPTRRYEGDAGYDLYVAEDVTVPPGEFRDIPTQVAVQMPKGVWGRITGRSSTLRRLGLLVVDGVIDNEYRGEMFFGVQNLGNQYVTVKAGERLAQFILHPIIAPGFERVERLSDTTRGEGGFGSTGK